MFGTLLVDALVVGILGLLVGSFLNVVIHRLPQMMERQWTAEYAQYAQESGLPVQTGGPANAVNAADAAPFNLWTPRSRCPSCGHGVRWFENIPVLSWLFLRERVARRTWVAVACAVIGIALFSLSKPEHPAQSGSALEPDNAIYLQWLGYALLLCASVCEGAYSVIGKKLTGAMGPKRITSLINLWGFLLSMPFGLYLAWGFDFAAVPWSIWLLLLFYALAACMWTVWLWMTGLRAVPAAQGGVFTVLLPVSAALVGVLALGESLNAMQLLAFALALASVLLATLPSRLARRVRS